MHCMSHFQIRTLGRRKSLSKKNSKDELLPIQLGNYATILRGHTIVLAKQEVKYVRAPSGV